MINLIQTWPPVGCIKRVTREDWGKKGCDAYNRQRPSCQHRLRKDDYHDDYLIIWWLQPPTANLDYVIYKKMIHDDCLVGLETMTLIVINMMNIIHGIIMYGLKVKFYTYYKVIFWQTLSFVQVLTLRRNKHFKKKKSSSWFLPHKKLWLGHPFCKHCQRHKRPKSWLVLSFAKSMANIEATLAAITCTTRNL